MLVLGPEFEQAIIAAAEVQGLNLEPGSLRIDTITLPDTTVRFTLVLQVPGSVVKQAASAVLAG